MTVPFVEVEWWDAFAMGGWTSRDQLDEKLGEYEPERTRGYLVHSEGEVLVLAMNETDLLLNCHVIPKCCVVRVRRV